MKCVDDENISDYLCNELPEAARAEIMTHLAGCAPCRRRLEELERVRSAVASAPPARVSADFTAALMRELEEEKPAPARGFLRALLRPAYGLAAAALAVCLVIGIVFLKKKTAPAHPAERTIFLSDGPAAADRGAYGTADIPLETGADISAGEHWGADTDACRTADCGIS